MKTITTDELLNLIDANEDLNIIDVREENEVANGMIPGAVHIPLGEIPAKAAALNKETTYMIVCHAGGRSFSACSYLEGEGFDVTNIEGGMSAWDGELEF